MPTGERISVKDPVSPCQWSDPRALKVNMNELVWPTPRVRLVEPMLLATPNLSMVRSRSSVTHCTVSCIWAFPLFSIT